MRKTGQYLQKENLLSGLSIKRGMCLRRAWGISKLIFIVAFCAAISSCQKSSTIGFGVADAIDVAILDTFEVSSSTVLIDSLPTSGTGVILLGNTTDAELGNSQASSYFHLSIPATTEVDKNAVFDSVLVNLDYSGYYSGDTTQYSTIEVHQLSKILELEDNKKYSDPDEQSIFIRSAALYNKTNVNYNSTILGSRTFKPRPNSNDSITVKIDNTLGQALFTLLKDASTKITDQTKFTDYIKGLAIIPKNGGNAIVGYKTSTAGLQLYYSEHADNGVKVSRMVQFSLADSTLQYNKITTDRSASTLKNLTSTKTELTSAETANHCYVQGGAGVLTKIQFPGIMTFLQDKKYIINKATLYIRPIKNSGSVFPFPETLILYHGDKNNKPQSILAKSYDDGDQTATLQTSYDNIGSSVYTFYLTEYLSQLKSTTNGAELSLMLSLPTANLLNSVNRLVVGGAGSSSTQQISLEILYTKYDY